MLITSCAFVLQMRSDHRSIDLLNSMLAVCKFDKTQYQHLDQPTSSAILTIVLVCLLILIVLVVIVVVFMTRCRKQMGGKSAVLNDPSSAEEGQTLVPQTAEKVL